MIKHLRTKYTIKYAKLKENGESKIKQILCEIKRRVNNVIIHYPSKSFGLLAVGRHTNTQEFVSQYSPQYSPPVFCVNPGTVIRW